MAYVEFVETVDRFPFFQIPRGTRGRIIDLDPRTGEVTIELDSPHPGLAFSGDPDGKHVWLDITQAATVLSEIPSAPVTEEAAPKVAGTHLRQVAAIFALCAVCSICCIFFEHISCRMFDFCVPELFDTFPFLIAVGSAGLWFGTFAALGQAGAGGAFLAYFVFRPRFDFALSSHQQICLLAFIVAAGWVAFIVQLHRSRDTVLK